MGYGYLKTRYPRLYIFSLSPGLQRFTADSILLTQNDELRSEPELPLFCNYCWRGSLRGSAAPFPVENFHTVSIKIPHSFHTTFTQFPLCFHTISTQLSCSFHKSVESFHTVFARSDDDETQCFWSPPWWSPPWYQPPPKPTLSQKFLPPDILDESCCIGCHLSDQHKLRMCRKKQLLVFISWIPAGPVYL